MSLMDKLPSDVPDDLSNNLLCFLILHVFYW